MPYVIVLSSILNYRLDNNNNNYALWKKKVNIFIFDIKNVMISTVLIFIETITEEIINFNDSFMAVILRSD